MTADALRRAQRLLADPSAPGEVVDGYLDLVGDGARVHPTVAQRAMGSTLLPVIYERIWRPVGFTAFTGRTTGQEERHLLRALAPEPGDTVLDLACGPGNTTRRLHDAVGDGLVVGVDFAPGMLARAVRDTTSDAVAYVRADAHRLPFADGSFDAAACYGALYLVERPEVVLAELVRVLRPGGRLAVLTSCHRGPRPLRAAVDLTHGISGVRVFGRDEVVATLVAAGAQNVQRSVSAFSQTVTARRPVASSTAATSTR